MLWRKQKIKPEETYRLMRYVIRVDHEGKTALYNVVTGQLILLDANEAQMLEALPMGYVPVMAALIEGHFLVPEAYDEHKQVMNLRAVLRTMNPKPKSITYYTILPTTACNARCYYCFEQGYETATMTEQTAEDAVRYITEHCGEEKNVWISWFGGEPTVAANRIDQICEGLQKNGIAYTADITTNGYLFDEEMVAKARDVWHITAVMISVDGVGETYNKVKAYVNPKDDPYQRVMRNVGLLLKAGIQVKLRLNYDVDNYGQFELLVKDAAERYRNLTGLTISAHPIIGAYAGADGSIRHGSEDWLGEQWVKLNSYAREHGLQNVRRDLPSLRYKGCRANEQTAVVITATGDLARCPEQTQAHQVTGTLNEGETNADLVRSWQAFSEEPGCSDCVIYPFCFRLTNCSASGLCTSKLEEIDRVQTSIKEYIKCTTNEGEKSYEF